ncbi:hypothetical protein MMPV_005518 [Pyropia vietnamensis]
MTLFSVAAFFIVLREVLEACLVIGIILAYLTKTGTSHMAKWVWMGTAAGFIISVAAGVALAIVFYVRGSQLFNGTTAAIFEGATYSLAVVLLTWMIVWMAAVGRRLRETMEASVERALDAGGGWRLAFLSLVQVAREGIETVIFMAGAAGGPSAHSGTGWRSIPLPAVTALALGVAASVATFRGLLALDMTRLLVLTSGVLVAFAAGLASRAAHEFQEANLIGGYEGLTQAARPWWNQELWDASGCCNDKSNMFFGLARALFGYADSPTFVEVIVYLVYWVIIAVLFGVLHADHLRNARSATATYVRWTSSALAIAGIVGLVHSAGHPSWAAFLLTAATTALGALSMAAAFDLPAYLLFHRRTLRRAAMVAVAVGGGALLSLTTAITVAQLVCEGTRCDVPQFLHWGLVLDSEWAGHRPGDGAGVDGTGGATGYAYVAVLTLSLGASIALCGSHTAGAYFFARNLDADGAYHYDEPLSDGIKLSTVVVPASYDDDDREVAVVAGLMAGGSDQDGAVVGVGRGVGVSDTTDTHTPADGGSDGGGDWYACPSDSSDGSTETPMAPSWSFFPASPPSVVP